MKRGIIIGKFMPPHTGHLALIEFGLKQVDDLVLCVCSSKLEPISGKLRYGWMKSFLKNNPKIKVFHIWQDLPHNPVPTREGSRIWAEYLTKRFGKFDYIFTSEEYGGFMAGYMGAENMTFDIARVTVPISGTMIRNDPKKYGEYILPVARRYFKLK